MTLHLHTAQLASHGRPGYRGNDLLDVTRGTGGRDGDPFAPSRQLLNEGLRLKRAANGDEAQLVAMWDWYAPRYVEEMRASYRANRAAWDALLAREQVVLGCYCGTAHRCHRRLLAGILVRLGAVDLGEIAA